MKWFAIFALICVFALVVSAVENPEKDEVANVESGLDKNVRLVDTAEDTTDDTDADTVEDANTTVDMDVNTATVNFRFTNKMSGGADAAKNFFDSAFNKTKEALSTAAESTKGLANVAMENVQKILPGQNANTAAGADPATQGVPPAGAPVTDTTLPQ
ncbi:hypothetical protein M3Y95_00211600 [Aphelenchoides besseyi]|nr:hypothetical protein M3Y95_00211600 [Aphelenchoides besseyi]